MKKILQYIKENKHCLLLLYWPVHTLWYELIRIFNAESEVWLIHSPLDDRIPFCEWFLIPYCIWYLYIAAVLLNALLRGGKREFLRSTSFAVGCMILPMIFCTLVPNGIPLSMRPDFDALGRENLLTKGVELLYASDSPPLSVMPSMHVSVSMALFCAVMTGESLKGKKLLKAASLILSLLICMSTVFIKQHSILDVFWGIVTAAVVFAAVTIAEKTVFSSKKTVA